MGQNPQQTTIRILSSEDTLPPSGLQDNTDIALLLRASRFPSSVGSSRVRISCHLPIHSATFRQPASHSPQRHIALYTFPSADHFHLNLLRNPSTAHPTTYTRHNYSSSVCPSSDTFAYAWLLTRDTCSHGPAHKHLLVDRTPSPLNDPLVQLHPYTRAKKLTQRA